MIFKISLRSITEVENRSKFSFRSDSDFKNVFWFENWIWFKCWFKTNSLSFFFLVWLKSFGLKFYFDSNSFKIILILELKTASDSSNSFWIWLWELIVISHLKSYCIFKNTLLLMDQHNVSITWTCIGKGWNQCLHREHWCNIRSFCIFFRHFTVELKHVEPKHFWGSGTLKQHQAVQFMPYNKAVSKYGIRIIKKNNIYKLP